MTTAQTSPTAAILVIGNEVLSAKVVDKNGPFLLQALRLRGIWVNELRVVGDVIKAIGQAALELAKVNTYVFTTGGIGPTHDDITIPAIAKAFAREVVHAPELIARLEKRAGPNLSATRLRLAEVPQGAILHPVTDYSLLVIQFENLFIFPGVPDLMRQCFNGIAHLLSGPPIHTRELYCIKPEHDIAEMMLKIQNDHPEVLIGSYPRYDDAAYRVKISVDGTDLAIVDRVVQKLRNSIPPNFLLTTA